MQPEWRKAPLEHTFEAVRCSCDGRRYDPTRRPNTRRTGRRHHLSTGRRRSPLLGRGRARAPRPMAGTAPRMAPGVRSRGGGALLVNCSSTVARILRALDVDDVLAL